MRLVIIVNPIIRDPPSDCNEPRTSVFEFLFWFGSINVFSHILIILFIQIKELVETVQ